MKLQKQLDRPLKIIIIGLGDQMRKDHIPAILRRKDLNIIAVVDKDKILSQATGIEFNVSYYTDLKDALAKIKPDLVIVSVPHNEYFTILELLANNHIATLKEKPLAMTIDEAKKIINLYKSSGTYLQICVQRRFSELYDTTKDLTTKIGRIYSMYTEYTLSLTANDMASGWRADKNISGGGATLDMGYHIIDLLTYIFGIPDKLYSQLSYNSLGDNYSIDDTMKTMMTFDDDKINANIVVTKISNEKNEKVRIFGTEGSVYVDGRKITQFDKNKNEIVSYIFNSKEHEVDRQLEYFVKNHDNKELIDPKNNRLLADQEINMIVIDAIYKSNEYEKVIKF